VQPISECLETFRLSYVVRTYTYLGIQNGSKLQYIHQPMRVLGSNPLGLANLRLELRAANREGTRAVMQALK
jgi:hypothetical protein